MSVDTPLRPAEAEAAPVRRRDRSGVVVVGLWALLAVPLVVALAALRHPRWYPVLDLAQTELRVRDVPTSHPPLFGLAGRIGRFGDQGSHPGPMSFWAMWPIYRVFGATSWAMQVASATLHLLAMGTALWVANRRGGLRLAIGVFALLALLARAYGAATLTEAWNPYLPLLFWFAFLLSVWAVLDGDDAVLPVAVVTGTFCAQTHVPYLGLAVGLGVVTAVVLVVRRRSRNLRWVVVALAVGAVLWLPPLVEQATASGDGNVTKLVDYFTDPPEASIGPRRGLEVLLVHLDPSQLLARRPEGGLEPVSTRWSADGPIWPGTLVLGAWAACVVVAWRRRHRALLALDGVIAASLVFAVLSLSRIFGFLWYYLSLWAGGIAALVLLSIGWTIATVVGDRSRRLLGGVGVAGVVLVGLFAFDARDVESPDLRVSSMVGDLSPPTAAALDPDGRYLVTWTDPVNIGAPGFGLLLELERQGFDVGVTRPNQAAATKHRVLDPSDATAVVHLAVGPDVERWRSLPSAREVAFVEPRSRAEREEYERVRSDVLDELSAAGLGELGPALDENVFVTANSVEVPQPIRDRIQRMIDLGLPAAVFLAPPGVEPPA